MLNWFQGLIAAILPAHERAKTGCAYGMMQKTFAPQVTGEKKTLSDFCVSETEHKGLTSFAGFFLGGGGGGGECLKHVSFLENKKR